MKKIRFVFVLMAVASLSAYIFSGCKDKDKVAPLIFINGSNPYTAELNKPYHDSLAIAEDNLDGTITGSMVIGHNIPMKYVNGDSVTSKTGIYQVTYSATDKAGNQKTVTRTVYVKNWDSKYEASYIIYRKKSPHMDSIGCQYWKYYPYRTVVQKFNLTADKDTNMKATFPIGGEIKVKVDGYFVPSTTTTDLHIKINPQPVWGIKGWNGTIVDTARTLYFVSGLSSTGSDHSASFVENQNPGHLRIILKYYISKFTNNNPLLPGQNITYTDTLNQRY